MRRSVVGQVTSDKMQKTIRVSIPRRIKDVVTGKFISRETVCLAHDENEEASRFDIVELVESRPISKKKRWELVRIVSSEVSR